VRIRSWYGDGYMAVESQGANTYIRKPGAYALRIKNIMNRYFNPELIETDEGPMAVLIETFTRITPVIRGVIIQEAYKVGLPGYHPPVILDILDRIKRLEVFMEGDPELADKLKAVGEYIKQSRPAAEYIRPTVTHLGNGGDAVDFEIGITGPKMPE